MFTEPSADISEQPFSAAGNFFLSKKLDLPFPGISGVSKECICCSGVFCLEDDWDATAVCWCGVFTAIFGSLSLSGACLIAVGLAVWPYERRGFCTLMKSSKTESSSSLNMEALKADDKVAEDLFLSALVESEYPRLTSVSPMMDSVS